MEKYYIRAAKEEDAQELLSIYSPYILETAITFEYEVPSVEEFKNRIRTVLKKYPYLVAQRKSDGQILGYAYAGPFHPRAAFGWAVETTVYLRRECRGGGIGKRLYEVLEEALYYQNITNLYASIAYPIEEDEYLTKNSMQFHEHMGFRLNAEFVKSGYKFSRWYNLIWMEKYIRPHLEHQPPVKPFCEIMHLVEGIRR